MAVPLTELQSMLDTLVRAMGNPRLTARGPDGREVTYRSMKDLLEAKAAIEDQIRESQGSSGAGSVSVAQHSRGTLPIRSGWPRPDGNW